MSIWLLVVLGSTFGPYLREGVRTEQLVVYVSLIVSAVWIVQSTALWTIPTRVVLFLWMAICSIAVVGGLLPGPSSAFGQGRLLAGIDNALLPMSLLLLGAYWITRLSDSSRALNNAAWMIAGLGALNAVLALLQVFSVPLQPFLARFWTQDGPSVALLALQHERYTGIFNQPAEAGLFYSLALLCLAYLWVRGSATNGVVSVVLLCALIGGSLLSQSKLVLIAGIPSILVLLIMTARSNRTARTALVVSIATVGVLMSVALGAEGWYGSVRLSELTQGGSYSVGSAVSFGTAGRFGGSGSVSVGLSEVVRSQPWFGFGASGLDRPTDSSWLEMASAAGMVGLALYVVLLAYLASRALRISMTHDPARWLMAWGLLAIAVLGGFGLPIATANRGGTAFWMLLILTFLADSRLERHPASLHRR